MDASASNACVKASIPVSAVILAGIEAVTSGSQIAISGIISIFPSPCFKPVALSEITIDLDTSLAVPLVDGIQHILAFLRSVGNGFGGSTDSIVFNSGCS